MTTTDETQAARPAGRPRSVRAEKAIIEATLDLIGESTSLSELSIEAIANRAGVGKTTIYRWWSAKEDLVVDALATLKAPLPPLAGRFVREDLIACVEVFRREACDGRARCVLNIAMNEAERHPRLADRVRQAAIEPRRAVLTALLERGVATGELRADLDVSVAIAALIGTVVWYMRCIEQSPDDDVPEDIAERIVDHLLAGLASR